VPPNASKYYHLALHCYLKSITSKDYLEVLGDFNFPGIDWVTLSGVCKHDEEFCDVIYDCGLSQLVYEPTYSLGNILDLVLTSDPNLIARVEVCRAALPLSSDHFPVFFEIIHGTMSNIPATTHEVFNYKKIDSDGMVNQLLDVDFEFCYQDTDVDSVWLDIKSLLVDSVNQFTPKVRMRSHPHPKWFTSEIRHKLNIVLSLRKKTKSSPSEANTAHLKVVEDQLTHMIHTAKLNFETKLADDFSSNKSIVYKYLREHQSVCVHCLPSCFMVIKVQATIKMRQPCSMNIFTRYLLKMIIIFPPCILEYI